MDNGGRAKQDVRAEDERSGFLLLQNLSTYIHVSNAAVP